jgi:drug/metabolite transporter (DMT)-like permease
MPKPFAYVLDYRIITSERSHHRIDRYRHPVVAIVLVVLVLSESITVLILVGMILVLAGVALTRRWATSPAVAARQFP